MELSIDVNKTKALLIGVSEYQKPLLSIPPALNNVEAFKKTLQEPSILGLASENIITITNQRDDDIFNAIVDFCKDKDNLNIETLLLYYVGHGIRERIEKKLYLAATNTRQDTLRRTGIPFDDIKQEIENSHFQHRIVFLDACHAGVAAMGEDVATDLDIKGTVVLTSTAADEKSFFDVQGTYAFFTEALLSILQQGTSSIAPILSVEDVYEQLQQQLKQSSPKRKTTINSKEFYLFKNVQFDVAKTHERKGDEWFEKGEYLKAEREYKLAAFEKRTEAIEAKIKNCQLYAQVANKIRQNDKRLDTEAAARAVRQKQRLEDALKTEIPQQVAQFMATHRAIWHPEAHQAWLAFRRNIHQDFGEVEEELLAGLLRTAYEKHQTQIPPNFVLIPSGTFTMGSPETEVDRENDETQHQVKLSDFYMCQYAVTLAEFKKFIEQSGYQTDADRDGGSYSWTGSKWEKTAGVNWRCGVKGKERPAQEWNHPVLHVSWNDCIAYCNHLSWQYDSPLAYDQHGNLLDVQGRTTPDLKQVKGFRLPTEAEWEYACRCNTPTSMPFYTGLNLRTDQANYDGNYPYNNHSKGDYRGDTLPVNHFEPNKWKLYNMHGNVWEWCYDWYDEKYYHTCKAKGLVENPIGPTSATARVLRGGSWCNVAQYCRSAYRGAGTPSSRSCNGGFRLVFVPPFIV